MSEPVTPQNAAGLGEFGQFRKVATTRISLFTVPPGTPFETPEGLKAEDEECRVAFDVQGGVYPIRESVFQQSYAPDTLSEKPGLDVERLHFRSGDNVVPVLHEALRRHVGFNDPAQLEAWSCFRSPLPHGLRC